MNLMEVYVSGRNLGSDRNVGTPNIQMQYAVLQTEDGSEIVEKMYFDRLLDFVYVELMKGLQKGFLPKRCPNCGRWFVQEPGIDFNYCDSQLLKILQSCAGISAPQTISSTRKRTTRSGMFIRETYITRTGDAWRLVKELDREQLQQYIVLIGQK